MGWIGIMFVAAAVALAGWRIQGERGPRRFLLWQGVALAIVAALLAKLAGNQLDLFHDGQTVEWLAAVLAAVAAVMVLGEFAARRGTD